MANNKNIGFLYLFSRVRSKVDGLSVESLQSSGETLVAKVKGEVDGPSGKVEPFDSNVFYLKVASQSKSERSF